MLKFFIALATLKKLLKQHVYQDYSFTLSRQNKEKI